MISRHGRWCPHCKHKTETKLYEFLKTAYPTTIHQFRVEWCKNKRCLPYDFCIPDLKIIIELDGAQHFGQVSNWKSPEETLENDLYKEDCATENEYHVIRLIQEDVWNDAYDWKAKMTDTIEDIKHSTDTIRVECLCENGEYDAYLAR
jgi:very-short-patch-repair endonuclease